MHVPASLRQFLQPPEFRIDASPLSAEALQRLDSALAHSAPGDDALPPANPEGPAAKPAAPGAQPNRMTMDKLVNPEPFDRFLGQLAVGLWRLRGRMVAPESGEPLEAMKPAWRAFESVYALLEKEGVQVQDHTGAPYRSGMAVAVVAFQPTVGIVSEQIIETIRPSIYRQGQIIQPGEVIVATASAEPPAAAAENTAPGA